MTLAAPGPHAFLIVISLGRFTPEEKSTDEAIELFGENACRYTMVLFTHKDTLEKKTIEEFLNSGDADLKQLVKDCDDRYMPIFNAVLSERLKVIQLWFLAYTETFSDSLNLLILCTVKGEIPNILAIAF